MRFGRVIIAVCGLVFAAAVSMAIWGGPAPAVGYQGETEPLILAGDGSGLARLNSMGLRRGPWLPASDIPPLVKAAALAAEDKRFFSHPGLDPLALMRAVWQNLKAGRVVSGGSTITMQLARQLDPGPRSLMQKLRETAHAISLEAKLNKEQILCQYLNRAPFGGPVVGLGAASRIWFGKHPSALSPAQAALLMALPQDPARLMLPSHRMRLKARRNRILLAMAKSGGLNQDTLQRSLAAPLQFAADRLIPVAPHFVRSVGKVMQNAHKGSMRTYLDPGLQKKLTAMAYRTCQRGAAKGLRKASVLVLRNSDLAVMAWVGTPDYGDPDGGQVDGVLARRQPGSALKPFIYGLALEKGRTLADMIEDEPFNLPVASGVFRPMDYDKKHRGKVRIRQALACSLNLPALRLVAELSPAAVLERLRALGLKLPLSPEHYGIGLALGNGEVNLLELTSAYAALARGGSWAPARFLHSQALKPVQVMDRISCRLIGDVLADDLARTPAFGQDSVLDLPFPAAVKTGTSQKHRDNWCVGYTEKYTVGVWAGNYQGQPMDGISGTTGAGPLWREAMLLLHQNISPALPPWPAGVIRRLVKEDQGSYWEYFAPADSGAKPPEAPSNTVQAELELLSPVQDAVYALDPDLPPSLQVLHCKAKAPHGVQSVAWRLNGRSLAQGPNALSVRAPLQPGQHHLQLVARLDGRDLVREVSFSVLP